MIAFIFLSSIINTDLTEWKGEFDEYKEVFEEVLEIQDFHDDKDLEESSNVFEEAIDEFEEVINEFKEIPLEFEEAPSEFAFYELIASQENRGSLLAYVDESHEEIPFRSIEPEIEILLKRFAKEGSTVIDYGMGYSIALSKFVGKEGKVVAFETSPEAFRSLFWQLSDQGCMNAQLYCKVLAEKEKKLDQMFFEGISLIVLDAKGREDLFLKGASETISAYKPVLIINMLGGIPLEQTDHYLREELHKRLEDISKMGYSTQRIGRSLYLARPLSE